MTISEAVQKAKKCLEEAHVPDYGTDAMLLLQSVCGISRAAYYARPEEELKDAEQYLEKVRLRAARIPLQQIVGETFFCGLRFRVTEDVLCPRQDTETLVEAALERSRRGDAFLDLCTGSGCIAVSLLCLGDGLSGCAADLSDAAIAVAAENAAYHGVSKRLRFFRGDLYDAVEGRFHMIVSNPPYIASDVIPSLMEEVRDHEPLMALDGGPDGLDFYRRILRGANDHLKDKGCLIVEIGADQGETVKSMFDDHGYESVRVRKDLAGLDRIVIGRK